MKSTSKSTCLPVKPTYQSNLPISEIHLSVKATYKSSLSVKSTYQSNLPISQIHLFISQIHLSVRSTYQSNPPVYQSNPPVYQSNPPVYQSDLPISQIHLSVKSPIYQSNPPISQICLSKSACPPFASSAVTRKPPNSTGPAARNPATGTGCFFHQSNYQLLHTQRRGFKSPGHSCFYTQRGLLNGTQLTDGTGNTRPGSAHSLRQISHNFKEHKNSLKNELVQGFYASNTAP